MTKEKYIKRVNENFKGESRNLLLKQIDLFYKENPKEFKSIYKDSKDFLKNIKIEVKSNIEIIEKGNLNGGIYHE